MVVWTKKSASGDLDAVTHEDDAAVGRRGRERQADLGAGVEPHSFEGRALLEAPLPEGMQIHFENVSSVGAAAAIGQIEQQMCRGTSRSGFSNAFCTFGRRAGVSAGWPTVQYVRNHDTDVAGEVKS